MPVANTAPAKSVGVSKPLFLDNPSLSAKVNIRPLVLLNIIDHYTRRPDAQNSESDRVIGTLLGYRTETGVSITNCFAVPHSESEEQVAINIEHHTKMYELHIKVNPKEIILGWYATGNSINDYSLLIHEFYSNQVEDSIHLTLDTSLTNGDMSIKCYKSAEFGPPSTDDSRVGTIFMPIDTKVIYSADEETAIDMIQRSDSEVAALFTDTQHMKQALLNLQSMLDNITSYVKKVLDGEIPANTKIGRILMDVVSTIPDVNAEAFEKLFNNNVQDLLCVMYLSNLTRTQLKIAEKLYSTL